MKTMTSPSPDASKITARMPRVFMLGTRGPFCEGGVEKHVDELVSKLSSSKIDIRVFGRLRYRKPLDSTYPAKVTWLWAPSTPGLEALVHTFFALIYAIFSRPDILHIHAIGPGLWTPIARLFGLRVVVTHHGFDYEREKWGKIARRVLRTSERMAMQFANQRIVVSHQILTRVEEQYGRKCIQIPNGVRVPELTDDLTILRALGLEKHRYVLQVSRCVPEKRQIDLVSAFNQLNLAGWKLVFVGDIPGNSQYAQHLKNTIALNPNIILAGYRKGTELKQLYTHAGVFVLPSSHEGLPIALLEALSFGLHTLASDIPSNREVGLDSSCYFAVGDTEALAEKLKHYAKRAPGPTETSARQKYVRENFDWGLIGERTIEAYKPIL